MIKRLLDSDSLRDDHAPGRAGAGALGVQPFDELPFGDDLRSL
jgi:hypothetical protein